MKMDTENIQVPGLRRLRLREIKLLLLHLPPRFQVSHRLPGLGLLHREKKCYAYQVGT